MTTTAVKPPLDISPEGARPLGQTYTKNGFTYELVLRDGPYAIFKQRLRPGIGCLAYEVIRIRIAPECTIMEKVTPKREIAPGNEDWGRFGWTFPDLERAKAKMRLLAAVTSVST